MVIFMSSKTFSAFGMHIQFSKNHHMLFEFVLFPSSRLCTYVGESFLWSYTSVCLHVSPPCGHHHVVTAMWSLTCGHRHVITAMWSLTCGHRHVVTAMWSPPCSHRHVVTAMWSPPCGHRHVVTAM